MSQCQTFLQSQFRGALLGLALAPKVAGLPNFELPRGEVTTGKKHSISLWRLALGLLRHHDSYERRRQWILSKEMLPEATSAAEPLGTTTVQALLLGDVLEAAMSSSLSAKLCQSPSPHGLSKYNLPIEQKRYYQRSWADMSARHSGIVPLPFNQNAAALDKVVKSVLCALHYSQSYGLAVKMAAQYGKSALLITGFLAGAMGSQAALPVLWQLKDRATVAHGSAHSAFKYSEVVAIADRLFAQWAGVLVNSSNSLYTSVQLTK